MSGNTISGSAYAPRKRALNSLVNALRAIGIDQEFTLPSIVVIGNQSAGKSSVVEAISGINVPRDSGTCTRCPFEIRLQHHEGPWSCSFKLRFHNVDGKASVETPFGDPIDETTKGEVEDRLRRAQLAVLNGHVAGSERFIQCDLEKEPKPSKFSSDVVVVEIKGPEVVDLTFIDLPGILQSSERDAVENLTKTHIEGDSVILLTLNTSDDIDNQRAHVLAQELDPQGERTVWVLTKPDLIEKGTESRWINQLLMASSTDNARYGSFCVRRPDATERKRNITNAEAEEKEREFFKSAPWGQHEHAIAGRLGIRNLVNALSEILCVRIEDKLPSLREAIFEGLQEVKKKLLELPEPPSSDPNLQMMSLCSSLQIRLRDLVELHEGSPLLQEAKQKIFDPFATRLRVLVPRFSHEAHKPPESPSSPLPEAAKDGQHRLKKPTYAVIYLDEVRTIKMASLACQLPGHLPYAAKLKLIEKPMKSWTQTVQSAFDRTGPILRKHILDAVSVVFQPFPEASRAITRVVAKYLGDQGVKVEAQLRKHVQMDTTPFTNNQEFYQRVHDTTFANLVHGRTSQVLPAKAANHARNWGSLNNYKDNVATALGALTRLGLTGLKEEDLWKLLPPDEWYDEMNLCADASAYWEVAYKRLIDDIPRIIHDDYFRPLPVALHTAILGKMNVNKSECAALLSEDPNVARKRQQLEDRKAQLEEADAHFERFERGQTG